MKVIAGTDELGQQCVGHERLIRDERCIGVAERERIDSARRAGWRGSRTPGGVKCPALAVEDMCVPKNAGRTAIGKLTVEAR